MGLDMYLRGEKYLWGDFKNPKNDRTEDGFKINSLILELGYWRKHPNLHGYIVNHFADGEDTCQKIDLDALQLRMLIEAIKKGELPHTEGFFFGASYGSKEEKERDLEILNAALAWLEGGKVAPMLEKVADSPVGVMYSVPLDQFENLTESRSIYYQASW